jgi:hypothetical protein
MAHFKATMAKPFGCRNKRQAARWREMPKRVSDFRPNIQGKPPCLLSQASRFSCAVVVAVVTVRLKDYGWADDAD